MTATAAVLAPAGPGAVADAGRCRPGRTLRFGVAAVALVVITMLVVGNRATLGRATLAVTHASAGWVLLVLAAVVLSFLASATGIAAAAGGTVTISRTALVEVAGSFCNRLAPGSLGGTVLRIRYLTCAGLSMERAVAAVTVIGVAGGLAQATGITTALVTSHGARGLPAPPPGVMVAVAGVLLGLPGLLWLLRRTGFGRVPRRWRDFARELAAGLRELTHDRSRLLSITAGPVMSSAARVLAFWAAAHAVGLGVSVGTAMLVYLAGTALAGAAPVPGGIGPAEFTLTAGLVAVGAAPGPALAAVLTFRLASFWLPSIAGGGALLWLRRRGALRAPPAAGGAPGWVRRGLTVPAGRADVPIPVQRIRDQVQAGDMLPIGPGPQGGGRAADTPRPTSGKGALAMPIKLTQRLNALGTVQKVLLAGTAAVAAAVIGTGAAYAATPSSPAPAPSTSQSQETTTAPDTDNVQSGDQRGPDTAVDTPTAGDTADTTVDKPTAGDTTDKPAAADTDNVQSGDQNGPDTGGANAAG